LLDGRGKRGGRKGKKGVRWRKELRRGRLREKGDAGGRVVEVRAVEDGGGVAVVSGGGGVVKMGVCEKKRKSFGVGN